MDVVDEAEATVAEAAAPPEEPGEAPDAELTQAAPADHQPTVGPTATALTPAKIAKINQKATSIVPPTPTCRAATITAAPGCDIPGH